MGGGPDINYPDQPSYGEGMADALKAQVQLLTGTGDFAETGSLESLLPLEESIRKKTAQTDTDVLRQTLLGSGSDEKYAPDGRIITGYEDPPADAGNYQVVFTTRQEATGKYRDKSGNLTNSSHSGMSSRGQGRVANTPVINTINEYALVDSSNGKTVGSYNNVEDAFAKGKELGQEK